MNAVAVCLVLSLCIGQCLARPDGAPIECCGTMQPDHSFSPQTDPAPYTVSWFMEGDHYDAVISGATFRGFFIQARVSGDDTTAYGSFEDAGDTNQQFMDCFGLTASGATHTNANDKTSITLHWHPDAAGIPADLYFMATVVQTEEIFWMNILSDMIVG